MPPTKLSCVFAGAILAAACGPTPPAGVQVVVTIDPAWDPADLFDHVVVTATGGGKRGVACLYPKDEVDRVVEVEPPATCADSHTAVWIEPPIIADWALDPAHDSIDFTFDDGDDVTVSAVAALGGGASVASANADSAADPTYPQMALQLVRDAAAPRLADCPAHLEDKLPSYLQFLAPPCGTTALECPEQATSESYASAAVSCVNLASRIHNAPGGVCPGDPAASHDIVWRGNPTAVPTGATGSVLVLVTAHFAQCASGDPEAVCPLTTACRPPHTSLVLLTDAGTSSQDVSCLPSYPVPMTFQVSLAIPAAATTWSLAIAEDPMDAASSDACFFDVYGVATPTM